MKFYLMWANHDVNYTWDIRLSWEQDCLIWKGAVNREEFENACRRVITQYFGQSNYYRIDGKPVFQIYELANLMKGLGGLEKRRMPWNGSGKKQKRPVFRIFIFF